MDDFKLKKSQKHFCVILTICVVYQGQEEEHKYDKHDYKFCGRFFFQTLKATKKNMIVWIILFPGKDTPPTIHSPGPRLVLLFKGVIFVAFPSKVFVAFPSKVFRGWFFALGLCLGGETAGSGFKAQYTFETEYQIPGNYLSPPNPNF